MGFEADGGCGEEASYKAGHGKSVGAERDGGGEDVGEYQEGEDLIALAEVAGGDDVEEGDCGEEECGDFVGTGGAGAPEEIEAEEGGRGFEEGDEEFGGECGGEMEGVAEENG